MASSLSVRALRGVGGARCRQRLVHLGLRGIACDAVVFAIRHSSTISVTVESPSVEHILDTDISVLEVEHLDSGDPFGMGGDGGSQNDDAAGRIFSEQPSEDVSDLDSFAKARVTNFLNRRKREASSTTASESVRSDVEIQTIQAGDGLATHYRGTLPLDLGEHGIRTAEGIAETEKDTELVTFMHAERIIDCLGYQLYGLASSQRRYVDALALKGRWAAKPGEPPKPSDTPNPPMLRYTGLQHKQRQASGVRLTEFDPTMSNAIPVGAAPVGFTPLHLTIASLHVIDPGSIERLRHYLKLHGQNIQKVTRIKCIGTDVNPAYIASVRVPLPPQCGTRVAFGKAPDRMQALTLALMHAESIIDGVGAELYPDSPPRQQQHSAEAQMVGRWASDPGVQNKSKWSAPTPPPLMYHPEAAAVALAEKSYQLAHLTIRIEHFASVGTVDWSAVEHIRRGPFSDLPSNENLPFVALQLGTTHRASLLLPQALCRVPVVAVGIADTQEEAEAACAMHALQLLGAMNVPIYAQPALQEEYAINARAAGQPVADPAVPPRDNPQLMKLTPPIRVRPDPGKVSGLFKVSHTRAQKFSEMREVDAAQREFFGHETDSATVKEASVVEEDAGTMISATRQFMPRSAWCLEPDTADHCLMVHPASSGSGEKRTMHHTLYSPRIIDSMARHRFFDFVERHGVPRAAVFHKVLVESMDAHKLVRCTATVPVPPEFGLREAVGEAPVAMDAEALCAMHAELILDTLGLPLFDHVVLQRRHAKAARSMGRYAPLPNETPQPPETPSPPFLRQERQDSLRWLRFVQKTQGKFAKIDDAPSRETSQDSLAELRAVRPDEIEPLVNIRIGHYLFRYGKSLANDVVTTQIGKTAAAMFRSQLILPVPTPDFGLRVAFGVSNKRAESVVLCSMHAERILDALGIHLHEERHAQINHWTIAKMKGRTAPHPDDPPLQNVGAIPSPPGLQNVFGAPAPAAPIPPENTSDMSTWNAYVSAAMRHIHSTRSFSEATAIRENRAPRAGSPWVNGLLDRVESMPIEYTAKASLDALYRAHGMTRSPRIEVSARKQKQHAFVASMPASPLPLTAVGFGHNRRDAVARCAMLAIEMLTRALPPPSTSFPVASAEQTEDVSTLWTHLDDQLVLLETSFATPVRVCAPQAANRMRKCLAGYLSQPNPQEVGISNPAAALNELAARIRIDDAADDRWPCWSNHRLLYVQSSPKTYPALLRRAIDGLAGSPGPVLVFCTTDIEAAVFSAQCPGTICSIDSNTTTAAAGNCSKGITAVLSLWDIDSSSSDEVSSILASASLVVVIAARGGVGLVSAMLERLDQLSDPPRMVVFGDGPNPVPDELVDVASPCTDARSVVSVQVPTELVDLPLDEVSDRVRTAMAVPRKGLRATTCVVCDDLGALREVAGRIKAQLPYSTMTFEVVHPNDEHGARRYLRWASRAEGGASIFFQTTTVWELTGLDPGVDTVVFRITGRLIGTSPLCLPCAAGSRDWVSHAVAARASVDSKTVPRDPSDSSLAPYVKPEGGLTVLGEYICLQPGVASQVALTFLERVAADAPKAFDASVLTRAAEVLKTA